MPRNPALVDVLVVGAGPTGLFLANELAGYGCSFRIIDKLPEPNPHSRAFGLTPRTLEIFENRGMVDEIMKEGLRIDGINFTSVGEGPLGRISFEGIVESRYAQVVSLAQSRTEHVFAENLAKVYGGKVERGIDLVGYKQERFEGDDFDTVVATVKSQSSGEEEEIHARFIVGCDGVHSSVRKSHGDWTYDGDTIDDEWGMIDCKIINLDEIAPSTQVIHDETTPNRSRVNGFLSSHGMVLLFPYGGPGDHVRVICNLEGYHKSRDKNVTHGVQKNDGQFTAEDMQRVMEERLEKKVVIDDVIWVTKFRINERMVSSFRRGCAFLAGDAAHCHSPVGGQGLNTGVQDAHNLALKLHLVIHGLAADPERVLDSYGAERAPIARQVIDRTAEATAVVARDDWLFRFLRRNVVPLLMRTSILRSTVGANFSQKFIHYEPNDILLKGESPSWFSSWFGDRGLIHSGTIMVDGPLLGPDPSSKTTLYDAVRGMREHQLLLFAGSHPADDSNAALSFLLGVAARFSKTVKPWVITLADPKAFQADRPRLVVFADEEGKLHDKYGVRKGDQALVLLRPDMFVVTALPANGKAFGELTAFLESYLVPDS